MAKEEAALPAGASPSLDRLHEVRAEGILPHLRYVLKAARPRQWAKNGIVFMALLFSIDQEYRLSDPDTWAWKLLESVIAFVCFCMVASADYLVNDIRDVEQDRLHPRKRHRAIAAGLLSVNAAWAWAAVLAVAGNAIAFALDWQMGLVVLGYTLLMLAYSFWLKHMVLIDLMVIATGFVLRAAAGALAIDVPISPWLYVMTALGALFIGIYKRRAEIELLEDDAVHHRKILEEYNLELLDQMAMTVTAATVMAYGLYTFTAENLPDNHSMMLTIPFVLYGIFRYLYLVHTRHEGGSPEDVLLRDLPILLTVVAWGASAAIILMLGR